MDIEKLIAAILPVLMAAWNLLKNSEIMDALFKSDKLTEEQMEAITRLRKAAVGEFGDLAPPATGVTDETNT